MNVYDFDKTVYDGDSTLDFYFFCIKKRPVVLKAVFKQFNGFLLFLLKKRNKTQFKESFFSFLSYINNIDDILNLFWEEKQSKIKNFYIKQKKEDDVIISASPYFLLKPICKKLNINNLIASNVDKQTGEYKGKNCKGEEKVIRFYDKFKNNEIEEFYSDSLSDTPMMKISKRAFLVKGDNIIKWKK